VNLTIINTSLPDNCLTTAGLQRLLTCTVQKKTELTMQAKTPPSLTSTPHTPLSSHPPGSRYSLTSTTGAPAPRLASFASCSPCACVAAAAFAPDHTHTLPFTTKPAWPSGVRADLCVREQTKTIRQFLCFCMQNAYTPGNQLTQRTFLQGICVWSVHRHEHS
jgi:hypothetical protein